MGRTYLEYIDNDTTPRYCCADCGCDIASDSRKIWEGFMAAQQPAYLFRSTVNVDPYSGEREEQLSTGIYRLKDVQCRNCCVPMGWQYVHATRNDQKYKEGSTLLKQEVLKRINNVYDLTSYGKCLELKSALCYDMDDKQSVEN